MTFRCAKRKQLSVSLTIGDRLEKITDTSSAQGAKGAQLP
jgi:hypothetical protein